MRLLFVCLGNICRSPAAEGVFVEKLSVNGLSDKVTVDSAGTSGFHEGAKADSRMIKHAEKRGIDLTSRSRKFLTSDFDDFDLILVMDESNREGVLALASSQDQKDKVKLMLDYGKSNYREVPDPYYGGADGFELVLDLLDESCDELLRSLKL